MRGKRLLCVILVAAYLLIGCKAWITQPETAVATPTPAPTVKPVIQPTEGGELTLTMRNPKTLNPLLNEDQTVTRVLKLLFEDMVVLDEAQKPVPNLAHFNFSVDGLSAVITLRDGLTWSNGDEVTSRDVEFSINTLKTASDNVIYKDVIKNIAGCKQESTYSLRVNFIEPFKSNLYTFCFPIIPEKHYKSTGKTLQNPMNPLGNGLYKFESFTNMHEMILSVNSETYREKPYIKDIRVLVIPDAETELYSFDQNIVDVVCADIAEWGKYRGAKEARFTEMMTTYYDFIGFNFERTVFKERNIREAIARLVDTEQIINSIYLDHAVRAYTPINPKSWVAETELNIYDFDIQKATDLLNGFQNPLPFEILVNEENTIRVKIAEALSENMRQVGLAANVISLPFDDYEQRIKGNDYDLFVGGYNMSVYPDISFAFSEGNDFSYNDILLDEMFQQLYTTIDEHSFKLSLSQIQKRIASELPCISIAFRKTALLTDIAVYGEIKPSINNIYANINKWYIYREQ